MSEAIEQAIIDGSPNISLMINASDLKRIILEMARNERSRMESEAKKASEKAVMTRKEASEALGVTICTLSRWHKEKYLVPVKVGRKCMYKKSDIDRILSKKAV